ncbi:YbaK/EbsC family protein [Barrientosiimonas humi]|uniref:YbaK/EbsC family protein n=1 Tax=Barrientosiimonas humi TaxID=999931 RepID=UPI00370D0DC3
MSAEESVQLVDEAGQPAGSAPRSVMRADNLPHAGTGVFVRRPDGAIYVHQRARTKDWAPGHWDAAAGGVLRAGEDPADNARRELAEELGIAGAELRGLGTHAYADGTTRLFEHLFEVVWDGEIRWPDEEVVDGRWVLPEELGPLVETGPFVPDTAAALEQLAAEGAGDYAQLRAFAGARRAGLPFTVTRHGRVRSLEEAAAARGVEPRQLLKTMVVRLSADDHRLVLVPGDREIAWPRLRSALGVNRLTMPSADAAREVTGFVRGTITPFGTRTPLPVVLDASVSGPISLGGGAHGVGLTVERDDLVAALDPLVVDVAEPVSPGS